jgi:type I restriction enzyme S subunit
MKKIPRPLSELCLHPIKQYDPTEKPDDFFRYIDIGSVSNQTKSIASPKLVRGADASVRARQMVKSGDVLVSTVRPNLNTVALVTSELEGEICSTGFCVLRSNSELIPAYLFAFVQSRIFVDSLVELVQGALYPAVTDRQILAVKIPWIELPKQEVIAARFSTQFAAITDAKTAAAKQIEEINLLSEKLLGQVFES